MICIDTTVLIDEFRARGSRDAPVNRALLTHGAEMEGYDSGQQKAELGFIKP